MNQTQMKEELLNNLTSYINKTNLEKEWELDFTNYPYLGSIILGKIFLLARLSNQVKIKCSKDLFKVLKITGAYNIKNLIIEEVCK